MISKQASRVQAAESTSSLAPPFDKKVRKSSARADQSFRNLFSQRTWVSKLTAALPSAVVQAIESGTVNLNDPAVTLLLIKLDAVLGIQGFFNENGTLRSVGLTCAMCHSTVDNSIAPSIGKRIDGLANRDLNVGANHCERSEPAAGP
jgi:hypothetical protein